MAHSPIPLTQERLKHLLEYDPDTGVFRRAVALRGCKIGEVAGAVHNKGYIKIGVDHRRYFAHRLAWLYVHGTWPPEEVDHINRDCADNRMANLRLASKGQNKWNSRKHIDNAGNRKGAYFNKVLKKWEAKIMKDRKRYYLGLFDTEEQAHAAYVAKAKELFGEFARA